MEQGGAGSGSYGAVDAVGPAHRAAVRVAALATLLLVMLAAPVPVLDEESYLDIAGQLAPLRPYDWWRPWQPWGTARTADAYVFAHPPLHLWWTWLVTHAVPDLVGVRGWKLAAGAPWALLLGWAVGDLARATTRRPLLAVLTWLSAPIVVLGVQRGLMPDLAVTALSTAAVALWRRGLDGSRGAAVVGGLCLALATWTKYPAALLAPVLLAHGWRRTGSLHQAAIGMAPYWLAALAPVAVGEAWLLAQYGRLHPVEVLSRAGEIDRGAPGVRLLGLLSRLALGVLPAVLLLRGQRRHLLGGALVGVGAVLLAWGPAHLDLQTAFRVLPWAAAGGAIVVALLALLRAPLRERGPGAPGDTFLLAAWAAVVLAGVLLVHNFSAPRYLLPAMAPLALLLTRVAEVRASGRRLLVAGAVAAGLLAASLTLAEHRFFLAADALATRVASSWGTPGHYTGEWSFRWRMQQQGWTFLGPDAPSGTLVIAPANSSPGPLPEVKEHVVDYTFDAFPLRVVCASCRIGLYGETLGILPVGVQTGPLEEATAWRIR